MGIVGEIKERGGDVYQAVHGAERDAEIAHKTHPPQGLRRDGRVCGVAGSSPYRLVRLLRRSLHPRPSRRNGCAFISAGRH